MTAQKYMNHTMLRIADPVKSLSFYKTHFGMTLLRKIEQQEKGITNYYLALNGPDSLYKNAPSHTRQGILLLSHDENEAGKKFAANNGNKESGRGFGHICFSVPKLEQFCSDLEKNDVKFQKRLVDGRQKNIAFALDPDGYWIEIIGNSAPTTGLRLNHSMIRVKDKEQSLHFYTKLLGLEVIDTLDFSEAKFTLYFLAFPGAPTNERSNREGLIELTYNYGTESDPEFKGYSSGNEPGLLGFHSFGISVDDVPRTISDLRAAGVTVKSHGEDASTVLDPDGYHLTIIPQAEVRESASSSL